MSNISLAAMVESLVFWGRVQQSEGLMIPTDLERIAMESVTQHNPAYAVSADSSSFPEAETVPLRLLMLHTLALLRANRSAQTSSVKLDNFSSSDTPFAKNMKLAAEYMAQYKTTCQSMGLATYSGSGSVRITEFSTVNPSTGIVNPIELAMEPPAVNVEVTKTASNIAIIKFTTTRFSQFNLRRLFTLTGAETIYQPWNNGFVHNTPKLNAGASKLFETSDQAVNSLKVMLTETDPGTIHRFLIVTLTVSGVYGYSNEVSLTL